WYRRGPIGWIWNLFTMRRVVRSMMKSMQDMDAESEDISQLPMTELLPRYLDAIRSEPNDSHAKVRPPAKDTAVLEEQRRLGVELPGSVLAFYRLSDGLDWHNALRNEPLPRFSELKWGRDFDPPMSKRFRAAWEADGRENEEPEALQVTEPSLAG